MCDGRRPGIFLYRQNLIITAKVLVGADEKMMTLPLLLQRLNGQYATRWEWVFAASILALVPVVALFILFQRKMVVGGLTQGAVKG